MSKLISRRHLIAGCALAAAAPAAAFAAKPKRRGPPPPPPPPEPPHAEPPPGVDPETALQRLMDGNARFVAGRSAHPDNDVLRRTSTAQMQAPFATILACADSRVAPELVFDQGIGDLFVVRVAGNVVDDAVLASIEYSVIHLGSKLVMVLGHERCGAVKATIDALAGKTDEEDRETRIGALAALIAPSVKAVPVNAPDKPDAAVSLNAANAAADLFIKSPPLRQRVMAGQLKIVAARYDLDDGTVVPAKAQLPG